MSGSMLAALPRRPEDDPRTPPPGEVQSLARLLGLDPDPVRPWFTQPQGTPLPSGLGVAAPRALVAGALPMPALPSLVTPRVAMPTVPTVPTVPTSAAPAPVAAVGGVLPESTVEAPREPAPVRPAVTAAPVAPIAPVVLPRVDRSGRSAPERPRMGPLDVLLAGAGAVTAALAGEGSAVQHMGLGLARGVQQHIATMDEEYQQQAEAFADWLKKADEADAAAARTEATINAQNRGRVYDAQAAADRLAQTAEDTRVRDATAAQVQADRDRREAEARLAQAEKEHQQRQQIERLQADLQLAQQRERLAAEAARAAADRAARAEQAERDRKSRERIAAMPPRTAPAAPEPYRGASLPEIDREDRDLAAILADPDATPAERQRASTRRTELAGQRQQAAAAGRTYDPAKVEAAMQRLSQGSYTPAQVVNWLQTSMGPRTGNLSQHDADEVVRRLGLDRPSPSRRRARR